MGGGEGEKMTEQTPQENWGAATCGRFDAGSAQFGLPNHDLLESIHYRQRRNHLADLLLVTSDAPA